MIFYGAVREPLLILLIFTSSWVVWKYFITFLQGLRSTSGLNSIFLKITSIWRLLYMTTRLERSLENYPSLNDVIFHRKSCKIIAYPSSTPLVFFNVLSLWHFPIFGQIFRSKPFSVLHEANGIYWRLFHPTAFMLRLSCLGDPVYCFMVLDGLSAARSDALWIRTPVRLKTLHVALQCILICFRSVEWWNVCCLLNLSPYPGYLFS